MILFRDLVKSLVGLSAIMAYIIMYGSQTVDLFVNWGIISVANGKITIVPFVNYKWYIFGVSTMTGAAMGFISYKYFTRGLSYGMWPYILLWLGFVSLIAFELSKPVPWYGLALGFFGLFALFHFMFIAIIPSNSSKSKA